MGLVTRLLRFGGSLVLVVAASGGEQPESARDLMIPNLLLCPTCAGVWYWWKVSDGQTTRREEENEVVRLGKRAQRTTALHHNNSTQEEGTLRSHTAYVYWNW